MEGPGGVRRDGVAEAPEAEPEGTVRPQSQLPLRAVEGAPLEPGGLRAHVQLIPAEHDRRVAEIVAHIQAVHFDLSAAVLLEIYIPRGKTARHGGAVIHRSLRRDAHPAVPGASAPGVLLVAHPGIARPGDLPGLSLQLRHGDAQTVQLLRVLRRETVNQGALLRAVLILLRHEPGRDLRHLIAGDGLLSPERAVRIALHEPPVRQRAHRLIRPAVRRHIPEGIGSRSRPARSQRRSEHEP